MTPEQCRAARGWLDWTQDDLAKRASVSLSTVRDYEKGRRTPISNNLTAMCNALQTGGISLRNDPNGKPLGIEWTDSADSA